MKSNSKNKKIGRNDPCYCGSNIKYKKCHLNRHLQPEVTEGEVKGFASKQRVAKTCFHSSADGANCSGKIIEAHTVSKSGSLRRIARNGKVYNFKPNINSLFKNNGKLDCQEVGIGQASTFPGFCAYHDKQLFSPIEDQEFEATSYNATLLGYRAIAREIYAKQHQSGGIPFLKTMDKGKPEFIQKALQSTAGFYEHGVDLGLQDLLSIKGSYDKAFQSNDFTPSQFVIIEFTETPHILFSGAIYPEYDFSGDQLQELSKAGPLDGISMNAIATTKGGAISFQWFGESSTNKRFIQSLLALPENAWANAITQLVFEFIENLFISPDWWDRLNLSLKQSLEKRVMHILSHEQNCLVPDGSDYFIWGNPTVSKNIPE